MKLRIPIIVLLFCILVVGCNNTELELHTTIEHKVRNDPFLVGFKKNMELAFGCKAEPEPEQQQTSVYLSKYSVLGFLIGQENEQHAPSAYINIYCGSAVVERVHLDLELFRDDVSSLDRFEQISPDMIKRIRFETSNSFPWYMSDRLAARSQPIEPPVAVMSARVWSAFATQMSEMYPQGCDPPDPSDVFFKDSGATIAHAVPYRVFSAVLSCPKPGHHQPGFVFRGFYFPVKGFVLPKEIESGGAYVD